MVSYDAILFPADERAPHLISLMTSNATSLSSSGGSSQQLPLPMGRIPHPEMYMDFIAEGVGTLAWRSHVSFHRFLGCVFACIHPPPWRFISATLSFIFIFIFIFHDLVRSRSGVDGSLALPYYFAPFPDPPNARPSLDRLSRCWMG
jgi:hypothetical protein